MPTVLVIGGPNGAGKSTVAPGALSRLGITEFVNADAIAASLSPSAPEQAAMAAGRIMLARLRELAAQRCDFAFESTLSTRSFAPWLRALASDGYLVHVVYIWISSPEMSLRRVAQRVATGGHHVPDEDVRRRYRRGVSNFWHLYRPVATGWQVYNNSSGTLDLVASGGRGHATRVADPMVWRTLETLAEPDAKAAE